MVNSKKHFQKIAVLGAGTMGSGIAHLYEVQWIKCNGKL